MGKVPVGSYPLIEPHMTSSFGRMRECGFPFPAKDPESQWLLASRRVHGVWLSISSSVDRWAFASTF